MKNIFPAIFRVDEDNIYTVEFPDLKGCVSDGENLQDAMDMAAEALSGYLASLLDRGIDIPEPSDIKAVKATNGFCSYIKGNPEQYQRRNRAVKKTLSIPEWLNDAAEKKHVNFSSVLKEALIEKI
ncbi:type II toxin-antitoxin system HicB family antitoxin [Pectinatus frisingensis]|uniref:type II toxin-antitoxin system HicB family antitoxin n=1 Tax=Pectinatus frisingensis TaxID=865 RepID=UPI0015F3C2A4|nr:type II toxin-antitoxin system HicB family antitoxin [Pectinatus frisingensis]